MSLHGNGSAFVVTDTTASSPFSFAQAIAAANSLVGKDTIVFNIPAGLGYIVTDSIPDIMDTLFINGFSQPGVTTSDFPQNLLKFSGSRGLVIRSPECTITGLNIFFTPGGLTVIGDSLKNFSNTTISRCLFNIPADSSGINFYNRPGSLNSSGLLIDSVWVFVNSGQTALSIQTGSSSDIMDVTITHSRFQSYTCPLGCYAGDAILINRIFNSGSSPNYLISHCRILGKAGLVGYLDGIYVGHSNFQGECYYLDFENCAINNSVIEYNTFENGAAGCGASSALMLSFHSFLSDTIRNIHIENNAFLGGKVLFNFSGNQKVFENIFFEHDSIAGEVEFMKLGGNTDTVYISNLVVNHNHPAGNFWFWSPWINFEFSGKTYASDIFLENNSMIKPAAHVTWSTDSSVRLENIYIRNNFLNTDYNALILTLDGNTNNLEIASNTIWGGSNPSCGLAINCRGEINNLNILNNNLDTLNLGIVLSDQFRFKGKIQSNTFNYCGDQNFNSPILVNAAYVDTGYSLEIAGNTITNSNGHAVNILRPYIPPVQNMNKVVLLANSIQDSKYSSGINRQSQHDTASCMTCIPAPTLQLADYALGTTTVTGHIQGDASSLYMIEFFHNSIRDTSGFGEGEFFMGRDTIQTDASGQGVISSIFSGNFIGLYITATATSLTRLQTSEFSNNIPVISIMELPENNFLEAEIFPNPFTDKIFLTFSNSQKENLKITVTDITGQLVFSKNIFSESVLLDLSLLYSGVYIVSMHTANEVTHKKLIKQ